MPKPRGLVVQPTLIPRLLAGESVVVSVPMRRQPPAGITGIARAIAPGETPLWRYLMYREMSHVGTLFCPYAVGGKLHVKESLCIESSQSVDWYDPPFDDGRPLIIHEDDLDGRWWEQAHYRATDPEPELACEGLHCDDDEPHCHWTPAQWMLAKWARVWVATEKIEPALENGKWCWRLSVKGISK